MRSRLGTAVREALARFREYVDHLNDSTVIDLRNGRISIYIPVLIPIESLREVRDSINIRDLFLQPWQTSSLLDAYYRIKPLVSSGVKQYVLPSDGKKP